MSAQPAFHPPAALRPVTTTPFNTPRLHLHRTSPHPCLRKPAHAPCAARRARMCTDPSSATPAATPFPTLYDAWFPPNELAQSMQSAVTRAVNDGHVALELQWPALPNMEELSGGTKLNYEFLKHIGTTLSMRDNDNFMKLKRYQASFANLYWALQVAQCAAFRDRVVWALSCDSVSKASAGNLANLKLGTLRTAAATGNIQPGDVVIVMDPRANDVWKRALALRPQDGYVVFLNSQFSEGYGLTGPRRGKFSTIQETYFLKRVTRGYAFYAYPGPWRACLERPDCGIEELQTWDSMPPLRELAAVVRTESNDRYGAFNDRYAKGFGGRL